MADIEGSYEPFAQALRQGGFGIPVDPAAWPAELVAAHVIMSNDQLTEAAREVRAGREPTYDDEITRDGSALRELLIRTGSLKELAHEVERSASDLQAAYDMLDDQQRQTPMDTRVCDQGSVLVDEPRPIAAVIEGTAQEHLDAHLAQLLELRD